MKTLNADQRKLASLSRRIRGQAWRFHAMPLLLFLGIASLSWPMSTQAQSDLARPPGRIADIYGGLNHQPTRSEVESRERAASIEPNTRQRAADDDVIRELYEKLLPKARQG
jgi:hypothetical protein